MKKLFTILSAAAVVLGLASCGPNPGPTSEGGSSEPPAPITLAEAIAGVGLNYTFKSTSDSHIPVELKNTEYGYNQDDTGGAIVLSADENFVHPTSIADSVLSVGGRVQTKADYDTSVALSSYVTASNYTAVTGKTGVYSSTSENEIFNVMNFFGYGIYAYFDYGISVEIELSETALTMVTVYDKEDEASDPYQFIQVELTDVGTTTIPEYVTYIDSGTIPAANIGYIKGGVSEDGKSLYDGESVSITGVVTNTVGKKYIFLNYESEAGESSDIALYNPSFATAPSIGDEITTSGTVAFYRGLIQVTGCATYQTVSTGNAPVSTVISVSDYENYTSSSTGLQVNADLVFDSGTGASGTNVVCHFEEDNTTPVTVRVDNGLSADKIAEASAYFGGLMAGTRVTIENMVVSLYDTTVQLLITEQTVFESLEDKILRVTKYACPVPSEITSWEIISEQAYGVDEVPALYLAAYITADITASYQSALITAGFSAETSYVSQGSSWHVYSHAASELNAYVAFSVWANSYGELAMEIYMYNAAAQATATTHYSEWQTAIISEGTGTTLFPTVTTGCVDFEYIVRSSEYGYNIIDVYCYTVDATVATNYIAALLAANFVAEPTEAGLYVYGENQWLAYIEDNTATDGYVYMQLL